MVANRSFIALIAASSAANYTVKTVGICELWNNGRSKTLALTEDRCREPSHDGPFYKEVFYALRGGNWDNNGYKNDIFWREAKEGEIEAMNQLPPLQDLMNKWHKASDNVKEEYGGLMDAITSQFQEAANHELQAHQKVVELLKILPEKRALNDEAKIVHI